MHLTASERRELFHFASGYVPVQSSSISAISSTFPLQSSVLAASANPQAVGECSTSSSNQFKPSFFISECGRIHRYAVVQIQHGYKKSLGAILNFR